MVRQHKEPVRLPRRIQRVRETSDHPAVQVLDGTDLVLYAPLVPHLVRRLHMDVGEVVPVLQKRMRGGVRLPFIVRVEAAVGSLDPSDVDEEAVASRLYTAGLPDPDLLIRTSGELRLSNYLLWQLAYTEFYVTPTLWPDFSRWDFLRAVVSYQSRSRRFGGVVTS